MRHTGTAISVQESRDYFLDHLSKLALYQHPAETQHSEPLRILNSNDRVIEWFTWHELYKIYHVWAGCAMEVNIEAPSPWIGILRVPTTERIKKTTNRKGQEREQMNSIDEVVAEMSQAP